MVVKALVFWNSKFKQYELSAHAHAKSAGIKSINWPNKVQVAIDLYSGRNICRQSKVWSLKMRQNESRFIFAGSEKIAQKIKHAMKKQALSFRS